MVSYVCVCARPRERMHMQMQLSSEVNIDFSHTVLKSLEIIATLIRRRSNDQKM